MRCCAAEALANIDDQRAVLPLISALRVPDSMVRSRAAKGLRFADAGAVDPLIAALGDSDDFVSGHAAEALGKIRDPRAVER